jgi:GNAT superfamily N-acetyltransferase
MVIEEMCECEKHLEPSQFREAINIYQSSFPSNEIRPIEKVVAMLNTDKDYRLCVSLEDNSVVGISLMYIFRDLSIGLLDYMAVKPKYQRRKIGKRLFEYTFEKFRSAIPNGVGLLMEIQRETFLNQEDRTARKDRIRFYIREGAKILDGVDYLLPPIQNEMKPELMYLMIKTVNEIIYLSKESVIQYIDAIYSKIYQYRSSDLLDRISQKLPEKITLRNMVV